MAAQHPAEPGASSSRCLPTARPGRQCVPTARAPCQGDSCLSPMMNEEAAELTELSCWGLHDSPLWHELNPSANRARDIAALSPVTGA